MKSGIYDLNPKNNSDFPSHRPIRGLTGVFVRLFLSGIVAARTINKFSQFIFIIRSFKCPSGNYLSDGKRACPMDPLDNLSLLISAASYES